MKSLFAFRLSAVLLMIVFSCGVSHSAVSKDYGSPGQATIQKAKLSFDVVYLDDAILPTIPVNRIGFHEFVYPLNEGVKNVIIPCANAPPDNRL